MEWLRVDLPNGMTTFQAIAPFPLPVPLFIAIGGGGASFLLIYETFTDSVPHEGADLRSSTSTV